MMSHRRPLSGNDVFKALRTEHTIVMAVNVRMTRGITRGIMRSAKDNDAPVIFEIARSESDLSGGYTGMTPKDYYDEVVKAAHEADHDIFVVHADHISIKKGDAEDLDGTKKLIAAQIEAGFTSYAIDASHLFDFKGRDLREELKDNIRCTSEIAHFIKDRMGNRTYGLEVEVGEIGKTDATGRVLTRPEEAVAFLSALSDNGVHPDLLAIANGSAHGNTFDDQGKIIPQVSIDIPQTKAVARAIKEAGFPVAIAQHGITGTPRETINLHFPKGDILKGNVGTHWQNIFYDVIKVYEPDLYDEMWKWTLSTYGPKNPGKPEEMVFGKNCKNAFKPFKGRMAKLGKDTELAMEAMAYAESNLYLKAFSAQGAASKVRSYMESR